MPAVAGRNYSNGDAAIGVGLVVAFIATFLPWYSASFSCSGSALCNGLNTSFSVSGLNDWPGWLFFLAVLAGLALFILRTFVPTFTIPQLPQSDAMIYMIIGIFAAVMALLWLVTHTSGGGGSGYSYGPSFGLFIGIVAAIAVAVGGYLKRSDPQVTVSSYGTTSGNSYGGGSSPPPPPPV